jgi:hypothetical protein
MVSKLSKFSFPNCQIFPFQTVKISLFKTVKIYLSKLSKFPFQTVKIFLFKLSKFPFSKLSKFSFSNCQNHYKTTVGLSATSKFPAQSPKENAPSEKEKPPSFPLFLPSIIQTKERLESERALSESQLDYTRKIETKRVQCYEFCIPQHSTKIKEEKKKKFYIFILVKRWLPLKTPHHFSLMALQNNLRIVWNCIRKY